MQSLSKTSFTLPGQTNFYQGKVRDVYTLKNSLLVMVASDRISAFDVVLPRAIPAKGQVLNQLAAYFLQATSDIVPNWFITSPDPNVSIGLKAEPFKVEMVVRGYLAGHAARIYKAGGRVVCGVSLPEGLKENDKLPLPIITPTTKAAEGHDEDISKDEIIAQGIVSQENYELLEQYALKLFERGTAMAAKQGLILVDTKYEFGLANGKIILIDEIHTPDSSRYFYAEGFEERQAKGEAQKQLSKEFVRQWLIDNNFQGREGEVIPLMTDEWLQEISNRYIELFEKVSGRKFIPADSTTDIVERIEYNIMNYLKSNEG